MLLIIPFIIFAIFGNARGLVWIMNDACLVLMLISSYKVKYKNKVKIMYIGIFIIMSILTNIVFNGLYPITLVRVYDLLKGLIYLMYMNFLLLRYKEGVKTFILKELFIAFNIYFIVNIPIIVNQIKMEFNRDDVAGLVGKQGTHVVLMIWLIIIAVNSYKLNHTKKFRSVFFMLVMEFTLMMIFSVFSDNTAFYLFGALMFIYAILSIYKISKIIRPINILIVIVVVLGLIEFVETNEVAKFYIDTKIKIKIEQYTNIHNNEVTNEERVEMMKYGLDNGNGWTLGSGLGIRYDIFGIKGKQYNMEPLHINMTDMSAMIIEGGLCFGIIIILIYYLIATDVYYKEYRKSIFVLMLICLIFLYSKIISDERMIFFFSILNLVIANYGDYEIADNMKVKD